MKRITFFLNYLKYRLSAKTRYGTHSPFVYDLIEKVIYSDKYFYVFDEIEKLREELIRSEKIIDVTDLGTGKSGQRRVSALAQYSVKHSKYGKLLFRLVNYFQPQTILELGTSLGISTLYLAAANKKAKVITIEGCPEIASVAQENFKKLKAENIEVVNGNFDAVLSDVLCQLPTANCQLFFFDGNHRKESTLNYFKQCLGYVNNDSVFVFDDIYWSDEMEEAWEEIKKHSKVTVSVDLFFMGIVFFRQEQAKQDFVVRF